MHKKQWKIHVLGCFVRAGTHAPVAGCVAIIESGIRTETSPFNLVAVGPVADAETDGSFESWFVSAGGESPVSAPKAISVFVRVGRGEWKPYVQKVEPEDACLLSENELVIRLTPIEIEQDQALYVDRRR